MEKEIFIGYNGVIFTQLSFILVYTGYSSKQIFYNNHNTTYPEMYFEGESSILYQNSLGVLKYYTASSCVIILGLICFQYKLNFSFS